MTQQPTTSAWTREPPEAGKRRYCATAEQRLVAASIRYVEASAEVRALTRRLAAFDEDGSVLSCTALTVIEPSMTSEACRKWRYEGGDDPVYGERGGWVSRRPRAEWCAACVEIQRLVDARRAAKRKRASALSAIGNIARGIQRRLQSAQVSP